MSTSNSFRACAQFDRFHVDLSSGELLRSGDPVPIQEQPFQVLRLLLEGEGKVVTREQLRDALWPEGTFVDFEHSVNTAVKKLRLALGDSSDHPKFIETLPKFGYRFIAPVEWVTNGNGKGALPSAVPIAPTEPRPAVSQAILPQRRWKLIAAIALAALAVMTPAAFLAGENTFLSHTRLGMLLRRVGVGRHNGPQSPFSQRRLTANPDDTPVTSGVISPDGKYLAYTDATGFYLRQVDNGETHPVPLPKGFDAVAESWFPDSIHLVVSWLEDPKKPPSLWEISIMGGTPRKLADEGSSASVSPDGSKITFLAGRWRNEEIWVMQADGNNVRKIASGGENHFGPAAWAPDGKRFAYVRTTQHWNVERVDTQAEVYDVTNGSSNVILSQAGLGEEIAWTNAGRLIYSLQEARPNQNDFNLWSVQLDSRLAHASAPPTRITSDRASTAGISVASDGKRMALLRRAFRPDAYLTNLEAQGKRLSKPRRLTLDERHDSPFSWTPDSKAVLFISDRDGPFHIFVQATDQTHPELVVGGKDDVYMPRFSPDGSSVLYLVSAKPGEGSDNARLMRVPLSGGPSRFVLEGSGIMNQECARLPSTVCIYGQIEGGQQRFFTFDPAGGKGREIVAAEMKKEYGPSNNWALSPDGKYLVTSKWLGPHKQPGLRIFDLADDTERYIPVSGSPVIYAMSWAADSKSVWVGAFIDRSASGPGWGLLNIDVTGRVRAVLAEPNMSIWWAIPSPDGQRLALSVWTESSNVWLLENF